MYVNFKRRGKKQTYRMAKIKRKKIPKEKIKLKRRMQRRKNKKAKLTHLIQMYNKWHHVLLKSKIKK